MKRFLSILLLLAGAVSCADSGPKESSLPKMSVSANSLTIDGSAGEDLPSFGVTIDGADYTQYGFEVGDRIRIISAKGLDVVMEAESAGTHGIQFKGDFQPVAAVDTYYALYPEHLRVDSRGRVVVDLRELGQDGTSTHAAVLAAVSENVEGENIHFDFRPINTILYVRADRITPPFSEVELDTKPLHSRGMPVSYAYNIQSREYEVYEYASSLRLHHLLPGLEEGFFVSLAPYDYAHPDMLPTPLDLRIVTRTTGGGRVRKVLNSPNLKLGYSYTTTLQMPESYLNSITTYDQGVDCVEAVVAYANLEEIRCLITPEMDREFTAQEVFELGEPINGGVAPETTSASAPRARISALNKHLFAGLDSNTPYMMYAASKLEGSEGTEYLLVSSETRTLNEGGKMELFMDDPKSTSIKASLTVYDYDEVRVLLSEDGSLEDPKEIFEMGEHPGKDYGPSAYKAYRLEYTGLNHTTRYTLYAVGMFEDSGHYGLLKQTAVTKGLDLRVKVNDVTESYIWARADNNGYDQVRFYLSEDGSITDAKWVFEHGERPNSTSNSEGTIYTHYFKDPNLDYGKTYTIYCAGSYHDQEYALVTTSVTTSGLDPKVYCGAQSSYSYYKSGKITTANEMYNTAIAIGGFFETSVDEWPAYAYSTYEGIWDKDIVAAGIRVYVPGTSEPLIDRPLSFGDGYIGFTDTAGITYEELDLGVYAVKTYVTIYNGSTFYSEEKILQITGIPYDTQRGACHGFYSPDSRDFMDFYTDSQLKFYWEECNNGDKSGVVAWCGHDGVMLQSNLKAPRWPQILSPKFYVPEPFYVKGYMEAIQASGIDPVTVSLSQSTELGGDYEENGEQVHMVRLDLHFLKTDSATSAPVLMTHDYPCFQIEHESAFYLPMTSVLDLRLLYSLPE